MKFEVEQVNYINVNVDDVDVLLGAAKILRKRLSTYLKDYETFYYDKKKLYGKSEDYNGFIRDDLEKKYNKEFSERDKDLIKMIIHLENESLQELTDKTE